MSNTRPGLLRAAMLGLFLGLLLGGLLLAGYGARGWYTPFDCGELTPNECALERDLARQWGRMQLLLGIALALLGGAGLLWQRSSSRQGASE